MILQRSARARVAPWFIVFASVASVACGDEDKTSVLPSAGSGGAGGSSGGGTGGTSGTAGSSVGGNGGSAVDDLDAGTDASDASSAGGECVLSTIAEYCGELDCPALADARAELRSSGPFLRGIVQRPCVAANGDARIAVSGDYRSWSRTYVYDAATEQLVGVEVINDVADCYVVDPGEPGFGEYMGYYGEASPDCSPGGLDFFVPDACGIDAGAATGAPPAADAGPPFECVLTP